MRKPYKFRGPNTWALVREDYLNGMTATACAEKHDVTVHALKRRAANGGWTHRAHAIATDAPPPKRTSPEVAREPPPWGPVAAAAPETPEEDTADDAALSVEAIAKLTVRRAAQAMAEGRTLEAANLVKTAEAISRLMERHPTLNPAPDASVEAAPELDDTRRLLLWTLQGDWEGLGGDDHGPPPGWRPMT